MEKWVVVNKGADFAGIGKRFGIDPVTARVIRNRGLTDEAEIERYLNGTLGDLCDPHLLKDADLLVDILLEKIKEHAPIRIIGDYDIDGVMSSYILVKALRRAGAEASVRIPDRIADGYGLNEHLITQARDEGMDTILTCDNGIAALDEIALAKSLGMTVLVTDHHEIPFTEENGVKIEKKSLADAIVNPHQAACTYPNKNLCGAAVAWKVVCILFERLHIAKEEAESFLEHVAFATVGDIMSLTGENRILVKEGLKRIHHTQNIGLRALIAQCGLEPAQIEAYHFGYVLGPCINASGRLDTAKRALELLLSDSMDAAVVAANELVSLNAERKELTLEGVELAKRLYEEEGYEKDAVLVMYLPEVHESIAGIIAGRIRETYYKPTFILTKEQQIPRIRIDVPMPVDYVSMDLIRELHILEPFGKDNEQPVFADKHLHVVRMWLVGKNQNVLRLTLQTQQQSKINAIYFGDIKAWEQFVNERFGNEQLKAAYAGRENCIEISAVYRPKINEFHGQESIQFEIRNYC